DVLEIIAALEALVHVDMALGNQRPLDLRQLRYHRLRTHVRPNHPAGLSGGIRRLADLVLEVTLGRLIRHVDAGAGHVKLPAVVDAAQPALLVASKKQRGAPVRAIPRKEAHLSVRISERNQVFREDSEPNRWTVGFWQFT